MFKCHENCIASGVFFVLTLKNNEFLPEFVATYLNSSAGQKKLLSRQNKSGLKAIIRSELEQVELPNIPLNLEGVLASVLIKDRDEESKRVSLRTKDAIDVSEVAQKFSGGGHKSAAACIISGDIEQKLKNLIDTIIEKLGEKDV